MAVVSGITHVWGAVLGAAILTGAAGRAAVAVVQVARREWQLRGHCVRCAAVGPAAAAVTCKADGQRTAIVGQSCASGVWQAGRGQRRVVWMEGGGGLWVDRP